MPRQRTYLSNAVLGHVATLCIILTVTVKSEKADRIHLTYGDTVNDVNVLWATSGSGDEAGVVTYAKNVFTKHKNESRANRSTDGVRAIYFRAQIKNVKPNQGIVYTIKTGDDSADMRYFKLPNPKQDVNLTFLVSRSMMSSESAIVKKLSEEAKSGNYAGFLWLGNEMNSSSVMSSVTSFIPCLPTPGKGDESTGRYSQYRALFATPGVTSWPLPVEKLWYSFNIGPIHFISLNTEVFDDNESDLKIQQHNWLLDDLRDANTKRDTRPWIVAFGFQSLYCSDPETQCSSPQSLVRKGLEEILFQGGVDLVIGGEGRGYERTYPVFKEFVHSHNYTAPTAPIYVLSAPGTISVHNETDDWVAKIGNDTSFSQSYGQLTVHNASTLIWSQISASDGSVLDSFTIHQEQHDQFVTISPEENVSPVTKVPVTTTTVTTTAATPTINPRVTTFKGGENSTSNFSTTTPSTESTEFKKFWGKVQIFMVENSALAIGVGAGLAFVLFLLCTVCVVRYRRRQRGSVRRWDRLDCSTRYYKDVKTAEDEYDSCDEELSVDGNKATSKLLNTAGRNSVL